MTIAASAAAAFREAQPRLGERLHECSSGQELVELGFRRDVSLAAELNVGDCALVANGEAYVWIRG